MGLSLAFIPVVVYPETINYLITAMAWFALFNSVASPALATLVPVGCEGPGLCWPESSIWLGQ